MTTSQDFTDANGHVYIDGHAAPQLQAVGWLHRHPCDKANGTAVQLGEPFGCECGGTVLIGWRHWWPLPDNEPSPGLLIDTRSGPEPPHTCGSHPTLPCLACEWEATDG